MTATITAATLRDRLAGSGELALIDPREEGTFGRRHILLCSNIPLSRLEIQAPDAIPRRSAPVVLCDDGAGEADRAATVLSRFGYTDIAVLEGGIDAWEAAGLELFSGLNVPSKAFGEFVEHAYGTPSVSARQLAEMQEGSSGVAVLDSRPINEFRVMNIPGGVDMPGAELVHRIHDAVPDPETTIVVNCAGRTRSIIGAQSLINAGVPNPVFALENGTMGWHLAGLELEHGQDRVAPEPTAMGNRVGRERADRVARRFGVTMIDRETLERWRAEQHNRALYILDVRTIEEFLTAHIADSRHAPGGQLVQATDAFVAIRNARVVLVDDSLTRALMTASWLEQLGGCEVAVLASGLEGQAISRGSRPAPVFGLDPASVTTIDAADVSGLGDALFIDLQRSLDHRAAHPQGARPAIRAHLAEQLRLIAPSGPVVLTSPDGVAAMLAAADLADSGLDIRVVAGGSGAWEQAGLPMAAGMADPVGELDDVYLRAYDRTSEEEVRAAMNEYLEWEIALVDQISRPGGISFAAYPE